MRRLAKFWNEFDEDAKGSLKRLCIAFPVMVAAIVAHKAYDPSVSPWGLWFWVAALEIWIAGEFFRGAGLRVVKRAFRIAWLLAVGTTIVWLALDSVYGIGVTWVWLIAFLLGLGYSSQGGSTPVAVAPPPSAPPTTFGSAKWGTLEYMIEHKLFDGDGLILGDIPADSEPERLRYNGDRHVLTIAPTGSGKGVTAIIPNLLRHKASCLVVDPKGENALVTSKARAAMGQSIHIVDPWHMASDAGPAARFNPLDWLDAGDIDIGENAMLLADALVVPDEKGESFWNEEAKALLQGVILYVATDEAEADQRHLGRVRDLLLLGGDDMQLLFERMLESPHHIVASTGARCLQKEEKLLASVVASAQAQTSFLDSPRLRESLSASDFKFEDLKTSPMTIYLVLPADRLKAFSRWLRLLIQQAITVTARDIANKPEKPVLFLLDEMPSLGRLTMVKEAYGLLRGYGMQLWCVVQDAGQLRELYGEGWEGFIANSGAIAYHGSRDVFTAEYFSKVCGVATVLNFSTSSSVSRTSGYSSSYGQSGSSSGTSSSTTFGNTFSTSQVQRKLAFPDELMRLGPGEQLVLIEHHHPIIAGRVPWFEDHDMMWLGRNLHEEQRARRRALEALREELTADLTLQQEEHGQWTMITSSDSI